MTKLIRPQTVKLIARLLNPLTESNLIMVPEYREIIAQLQHLATHGEPLPVVVPKMINQLKRRICWASASAILRSWKRKEPSRLNAGWSAAQ